ncbi:translocation/assembly module TamB domain-containing protein [Vagococcus fessus]|uniref:WxL domain-containing protein n=1 Tax=Vagococcus fessus TaxID=120370 RepID=A0A430ACH6_9ENTE|nr:hypothetical protein [Vagococcus fessus]RSU04927.1 hypothetical protein CBF31_02585 [Vagococcus fessus]
MKKYSKLTSLLTIAVLNSNVLIAPVFAVSESSETSTSQEKMSFQQPKIEFNDDGTPFLVDGIQPDKSIKEDAALDTRKSEEDINREKATNQKTVDDRLKELSKQREEAGYVSLQKVNDQDTPEQTEKETRKPIARGEETVTTFKELKEVVGKEGTTVINITKNIKVPHNALLTIDTGTDVLFNFSDEGKLTATSAYNVFKLGNVKRVSFNNLNYSHTNASKFLITSDDATNQEVSFEGTLQSNAALVSFPEEQGKVTFKDGLVISKLSGAIKTYFIANEMEVGSTDFSGVTLTKTMFQGSKVSFKKGSVFNNQDGLLFDVKEDIVFDNEDIILQNPKGQVIKTEGSILFNGGTLSADAEATAKAIGFQAGKDITLTDTEVTVSYGEGHLFISDQTLVTNSSMTVAKAGVLFEGRSVLLDNSQVNGSLSKLYLQTSKERAEFKLVNKSVLDITGLGTNLQIMDIKKAPIDFNIVGLGTTFNLTGGNKLYLEPNTKTPLVSGLIAIEGESSTFNITEGAVMDIHATTNDAITMKSLGGKFNVDGPGSELNLSADTDSESSGSTETNRLQPAVLRFSWMGETEFNISNKAKISVKKIGGQSSAIRMYGSKNKINISGGADFEAISTGHGPAVHYPKGDTNEFNLKDPDSSVYIEATGSQGLAFGSLALNGDKGTGKVVAGNDTYFIVRGNTKLTGVGANGLGGAVSGAMQAYDFTFEMGKMRYYDFKNTGGGPAIFTSGTKSSLKSEGNDFSVWKRNLKGEELDVNPSRIYQTLTFTAENQYFKNITVPEDASEKNKKFVEDVKADAKEMNPSVKVIGLQAYSRITANNQLAQLTDVRVPTDADAYIYAKATIPQAKGEEPRPAYEGEVTAVAALVDEDGNVYNTEEATTLPGNTDIYGKPESGIMRFKLPKELEGKQKFLKVGQSVKAVSGYQGDGVDTEKRPIKVITDKNPTVLDATPAEKIDIPEKNEIAAEGGVIKGQVSEPSLVKYYFKPSGSEEFQSSEVVSTDGDGQFELPLDVAHKLQENDVIYVTTMDKSGVLEIEDRPKTNTENGNENPISDDNVSFHDATFTKAVEIKLVGGELTLVSVPETLDFGTNKVSTKALNLKPTPSDKLVVGDNRGSRKDSWRLKLNVEDAIKVKTSRSESDLTPGLTYTDRQNQKQDVTETGIVVEETTLEKDGELDLSSEWASTNQGFNLAVPVEKQRLGDYSGALMWTLEKNVENREVD